jgi:hypothetical protein
MGSQSRPLPTRFPVGTRYVIEGRSGAHGRLRVQSRYLEFPDGRLVQLPIAARKGARLSRRPASQRLAGRI